MPRYDYKCMCCGDIEEIIHDSSAMPYVSCVCGNVKRKIISNVSVHTGHITGFFDTSLGEQIHTVDQIKDIERDGKVFMSHDEAQRVTREYRDTIAKESAKADEQRSLDFQRDLMQISGGDLTVVE